MPPAFQRQCLSIAAPSRTFGDGSDLAVSSSTSDARGDAKIKPRRLKHLSAAVLRSDFRCSSGWLTARVREVGRQTLERSHLMITPAIAIAALLTLIPFLTAAFFSQRLTVATETLPTSVKLLGPSVLCVPYLLVACSAGIFRWDWLAVYALLPVAVSALMLQGRRCDPDRRGNWRDLSGARGPGPGGRPSLVRARLAAPSCGLQQDSPARYGHLGVPRAPATGWGWIRSAPASARSRHRTARTALLRADRASRWA